LASLKPDDTEFRVVWTNGEVHRIRAQAVVIRNAANGRVIAGGGRHGCKRRTCIARGSEASKQNMPSMGLAFGRTTLGALTVLAAICGLLGPVTARPTAEPAPLPTKAPWPWPAIPACLKDAAAITPGKDDFSAPACSVYLALLASEATDITLDSALRANTEINGALYPAFLPGSQVVHFIVTERFNQKFGQANRLVRVSGSPDGARFGSWWTTLHQVEDAHQQVKNADELRAELALTATPSCLAQAKIIHSGVRGYMGVVAPAFDQPGGGVEFWFPPDAVVAESVSAVPGGSGCPLNSPAPQPR